MPANLTDANAFTSPVQVPAGSDPRALTYLLTAFQALANRTNYLNKLLTDVVARRVVFALPTTVDGFELTGNDAVWSAGGSGSTASFDLATLPDGATVTAVRFLVVPSGSGIMTGLLTARTGRNFTTPNAGTSATVATSTLAGPGTSVTVIALTGLTAAVDKTNGKSLIAVLTSADTNQYCFGIAVDFNDPGPRNY